MIFWTLYNSVLNRNYENLSFFYCQIKYIRPLRRRLYKFELLSSTFKNRGTTLVLPEHSVLYYTISPSR